MMMNACAATAARSALDHRTSARMTVKNRREIIRQLGTAAPYPTPSGWQHQSRHNVLWPRAKLFRQTDVSAIAVAIRIRAEGKIDSLGRIIQIEMRGPAQSACAHRPELALKPAATRHIEFINNRAFYDIGNLDVKCEHGTARAQVSEEKPAQRTAAID